MCLETHVCVVSMCFHVSNLEGTAIPAVPLLVTLWLPVRSQLTSCMPAMDNTVSLDSFFCIHDHSSCQWSPKFLDCERHHGEPTWVINMIDYH